MHELQPTGCCVPVVLQVQNVTNSALDLLTQAGVELVPFNSKGLNDVSAAAWGAGRESTAYEGTDTLARSAQKHVVTDSCFMH